MARYGFDEENAKYIPEQYVQSEHIVAHESELGQLIVDYMNKTVTKILLAKNNALLNDRTRKLADELKIQDEADDNGEELNENYLKGHIVRDADGKPITDEKAMSEWVKHTFHFALSDLPSENAWIFDDKKHDKKTIAITTKMLEFAENSAQLEGIIAHELGHYFVSQRYKNPTAAINEKMADQHALDCLYYMGKSPDEYSAVFNKLNGIYKMNDFERIISGLVDEHGSPTSRLQDIDNYNEARYGDYIEELDENERAVAQIAADDAEFSALKQRFNKLYADGCYVGTLEAALMEEENLKPLISEKTKRIDIAKVPYEQVLDILLVNADDAHFCSMHTLEEAAYLLSHSSKEGLELNERITRKVDTLLEKVGISVVLSGHNYKGVTIRQELRDEAFAHVDGKYAGPSLARIIKEEAQAKGETLTAEQMAEKIEQILVENNLTITEKSQKITYHEQEFWLNAHGETALFLLLDKPQSPVLSPEVAQKRGEMLEKAHYGYLIEQLSEFSHNNELHQFVESFDKLCFAAAYPTLDLEAYLTEAQKPQNEAVRDAKEKAFLNEVAAAPHLTFQPTSLYQGMAKFWHDRLYPEDIEHKEPLSTHDSRRLPLYSRLAMDLPAFELPPQENAIGFEVPWAHIDRPDELTKFGLTLDENVIDSEATAEDFALTTEFEHFKDIISPVKFADGRPYDFITDKSGKIIAVGDDVAALKQQKMSDDEQYIVDEISAHFSQSVKTMDAIAVVSALEQTRTTRPLTEVETKQLEESMRFLSETPGLEPHLLCQQLGAFYRTTDDVKNIDRVKELQYQNIPDDSPQIDKDFEAVQKSPFYQQFFARTEDKTLSRAEKKQRLVEVQNWQAQDKTTDELKTIVPVIAKVLERRENKSKDEIDSFHFIHRDSAWREIISQTVNSFEKVEKEEVIPLILDIRTPPVTRVPVHTNIKSMLLSI